MEVTKEIPIVLYNATTDLPAECNQYQISLLVDEECQNKFTKKYQDIPVLKK